EDPNIANYTASAGISAATLKGVTGPANGTAILSSGWAQSGTFELTNMGNGGTLVVGDTLQVAGVYPANPQSRGRYSNTLQQFVVLPPGGYAVINGVASPGGPQFATATLANGTFAASTGIYTATAGGALTVTVGECLITGGQFQNVSTVAATFTGTPAVT